jgi:hypothetical protein
LDIIIENNEKQLNATAILDTGAQRSLISKNFLLRENIKEIENQEITLYGVNNKKLGTSRTKVNITIVPQQENHEAIRTMALVVDNLPKIQKDNKNMEIDIIIQSFESFQIIQNSRCENSGDTSTVNSPWGSYFLKTNKSETATINTLNFNSTVNQFRDLHLEFEETVKRLEDR